MGPRARQPEPRPAVPGESSRVPRRVERGAGRGAPRGAGHAARCALRRLVHARRRGPLRGHLGRGPRAAARRRRRARRGAELRRGRLRRRPGPPALAQARPRVRARPRPARVRDHRRRARDEPRPAARVPAERASVHEAALRPRRRRSQAREPAGAASGARAGPSRAIRGLGALATRGSLRARRLQVALVEPEPAPELPRRPPGSAHGAPAEPGPPRARLRGVPARDRDRGGVRERGRGVRRKVPRRPPAGLLRRAACGRGEADRLRAAACGAGGAPSGRRLPPGSRRGRARGIASVREVRPLHAGRQRDRGRDGGGRYRRNEASSRRAWASARQTCSTASGTSSPR